jgi:transposase
MLNNSPKNQCLSDFQRKQLQKLLQTPNLPDTHNRCIQIMLLADRGKSQAEICQELGCSTSTASRWILLAKSGQAHLWREHLRGRPKKIDDEYLDRLHELLAKNPCDYGYDYDRWSGQRLSKQLKKELGIKVSGQHINRLLKKISETETKRDKKAIETQSNSRLIIQDLPSIKSNNIE